MADREIIAPASEAEAADIIREAAASGTTLEIAGGGTKRGIGQPFEADRTLSSAALSGITEYNPAELVLTARAGTPVAEIEAALGENGQMLAFEPGDWRGLTGMDGTPTVGALAAANISGPRRISAGAARDALLGVRFVNGRGEIVKNGGKVMKNVTGLDLVKLMAGSWGTLGFLTEVSFKVLPRTGTEETLVIHGATDGEAANLMAAALGTSTEVSGAAHLPEGVAKRVGLDGGAATLLRLEGFAESIAVRLDRLRAALPGAPGTSVLDEARSRSAWKRVRDVEPFAGTGRPLWKVSVAPMAGHDVAAMVLREVQGEAFFDWQGGLVWLQLDDGNDAAPAIVREAVAKCGGGHATLVRAPEAVRASVPVFQPQPVPVAALSERVRAALDPAGIFNPGRMVWNGGRKAA
ncbi:glycolate oxidase subunit GlcE [Oricola thermophila]|uniref:Glycolate oxidase subunit GlcE n=1 Tax=Oricola thermophila TaxID=2742145 RepID=A0A6N1VEF7_9HYPH|nr:glycolate oxidase subunit GlcE [Oricola thermophila]QKV19244.1 glycolate oxidase subunit GlcE [Oricola thermophila]